MILSAGSAGTLPLLLGGCALLAYAVAVLPAQRVGRAAVGAFMAGVVAHVAMLLTEIGSLGLGGGMVRLGFGPVLSLTVCLTLAVHAFDGRLLPAPAVRRPLAVAGIGAVALGMLFHRIQICHNMTALFLCPHCSYSMYSQDESDSKVLVTNID